MADQPVAPPPFRERLIFDDAQGAVFDGPRRYLLIRPEALMGIFRPLPGAARKAALEALEASIYQQGSDSARAYLAHGGGDLPTLLETLQDTAPQLGWGRWRFEAEAARLRLEVDNSPFAQGFGHSDEPVCHAIRGMLRGLAGIWFGCDCVSRELHCAAQGRQGHCSFEALPVNATG
jgi:predicted hydrocarbon binding protein